MAMMNSSFIYHSTPFTLHCCASFAQIHFVPQLWRWTLVQTTPVHSSKESMCHSVVPETCLFKLFPIKLQHVVLQFLVFLYRNLHVFLFSVLPIIFLSIIPLISDSPKATVYCLIRFLSTPPPSPFFSYSILFLAYFLPESFIARYFFSILQIFC